VILLFPEYLQRSNLPQQEKCSASRRPSRIPGSAELFRQGFIDQAKEKIEEELKRNPSSVRLTTFGDLSAATKRLHKRLEAFPASLKLDANSTRTRNNLGNVYVAPRKADLAEKEFRTVLRLSPGIAMETTLGLS